MNKREILNEVIDLALQVEEMGSQLFVNYYPHIQQVALRLHVGGWKNDKYSSSEWIIYFQTYPDFPYYSHDEPLHENLVTPEQRFEQVRNEIMEACNVELAHE